MEPFTFSPIGIVRSCFREKFTIPRQPGLVPSARGIIKLNDIAQMADAIRGLEEFSHIWVLTVFHERNRVAGSTGWKPLVRPPRLGGAKKIGVLASRSPHRPSPIGMSAVRLDRIDPSARGGIELHISGIDILDGTPVLDVKPYIPYCDSLPEARPGWAQAPLPALEIRFSPEALHFCESLGTESGAELRTLITETLRLDPRPAFQANEDTKAEYAARILDFDVHWRMENAGTLVYAIRDLRTETSS